MFGRYEPERALHVARAMNSSKLRRSLSALPIFVLGAIAIVVSIQAVGCGDCRKTRGGDEICD
jgi:hypothetical protein